MQHAASEVRRPESPMQNPLPIEHSASEVRRPASPMQHHGPDQPGRVQEPRQEELAFN